MSSGCSREFPHAQPALGYGLTETNAVGCSNFWSNYAAKPASTGRAQKPFVEAGDPGRRRRASADRRARRDRDSLRRQHQVLLAAIPKRPTRCSPPTAMSGPATSAISTRTAICSSSTARRTSSSAAARISPRPRSRRPAMPAPASPKRRVRSARRAARRSAGRGHPSRERRRSARTSFARSSRRAWPRSRCRRD